MNLRNINIQDYSQEVQNIYAFPKNEEVINRFKFG